MRIHTRNEPIQNKYPTCKYTFFLLLVPLSSRRFQFTHGMQSGSRCEDAGKASSAWYTRGVMMQRVCRSACILSIGWYRLEEPRAIEMPHRKHWSPQSMEGVEFEFGWVWVFFSKRLHFCNGFFFIQERPSKILKSQIFKWRFSSSEDF